MDGGEVAHPHWLPDREPHRGTQKRNPKCGLETDYETNASLGATITLAMLGVTISLGKFAGVPLVINPLGTVANVLLAQLLIPTSGR
jgi:hypothetical protein